ncbi:MAG: efflux RND transporter periplasmic adaptor subunit [Bacteroidetes bacterium]|nr:efflux RND transporter periplasmic adaptor subunit [Bacteroidota bacterium]
MKASVILIFTTAIFFTACKKNSGNQTSRENTTAKYTCPMHPNVVEDAPGKCPVCGMNLVRIAKHETTDLMLTDSQIKLANIVTQKVSIKPIGQTLIVNAKLKPNEDQTTLISSRAAGRIEKLFIKETGRTVKNGEPLYEIYSETLLTLQREYLLALTQYQSLSEEKRYEHFLKAAENKLVLYGLSKKQVNQLAEAKTVQPRITFLAPTSGIVEEIGVAEGQYVNEGDKLYRIENINSLWLEAELYPHEASYVNLGDRVSFRVNGFESENLSATINFLSPEYRANTQVTVMRASLSNPGLRFKPGMQAQVFLKHSLRNALALPTDAVIRNEKGAHVYVQSEPNSFAPRPVKIGVEDFDQVEITSGLEENEIVVVSGAYLLYSELILKKGTSPMAEHQH